MKVWPELMLPDRVRKLWERRFPELTVMSRTSRNRGRDAELRR